MIGILYRCSIYMTLEGEVIRNEPCFYDRSANMTLTQLCQEMRNGWIELVRARTDSNLTYTHVEVRNLSDPGSQFQVQSFANVKGTVIGNTMPNTIAVVFSYRTGLPKRQGLGRTYFPGVPVAWASRNVLGTTGNTNYTALLTALSARYVNFQSSSGLELMVYSRTHSEARSVTQVFLRNRLCVVRSRNVPLS